APSAEELAAALEELAVVDGDRAARRQALDAVRAAVAGPGNQDEEPPTESGPNGADAGQTPPGDDGAVGLERWHQPAARLANLADAAGHGVPADEAIAEATVALDRADAADRAHALDRLADRYGERFQTERQAADLDAAITRRRSAVEASDPDDDALAARLRRLAADLTLRYAGLQHQDDLDEAIERTQESLELLPANERADAHDQLARLLTARHGEDGAPTALAAAIDASREAVAAHTDDAARARSLVALSHRLTTAFDDEPSIDVLDEAIASARSALDMAPEGALDRPGVLHHLSLRLLQRHDLVGDQAALVESIRMARAAVDGTPTRPDDDGTRATHLNSLANGLARLFAIRPDPRLLAEAVVAARMTVEATPPTADAYAGRLSKLAARLADQYHLEPRREILLESVEVTRAAVAATPDDSPLQARRLDNAASRSAELYRVEGTREALDQALDFARRAVAATADDDPARPDHLENLCRRLRESFDLNGEAPVIDEAIDLARLAVDATPADSTRSATRLDALVQLLLVRHGITNSRHDLEEAADAARLAVAATPDDSPQLPGQLDLLATRLSEVYAVSGHRHIL
ncbi:MAG: hypothetical protein AAGK32_08935, partial [Actinomycetota bacterium]